MLVTLLVTCSFLLMFLMFILWFKAKSVVGKSLYLFAALQCMNLVFLVVAIPKDFPITPFICTITTMNIGLLGIYVASIQVVKMIIGDLYEQSVHLYKAGDIDNSLRKYGRAASLAARIAIHNSRYWQNIDWSHISAEIKKKGWEL